MTQKAPRRLLDRFFRHKETLSENRPKNGAKGVTSGVTVPYMLCELHLSVSDLTRWQENVPVGPFSQLAKLVTYAPRVLRTYYNHLDRTTKSTGAPLSTQAHLWACTALIQLIRSQPLRRLQSRHLAGGRMSPASFCAFRLHSGNARTVSTTRDSDGKPRVACVVYMHILICSRAYTPRALACILHVGPRRSRPYGQPPGFFPATAGSEVALGYPFRDGADVEDNPSKVDAECGIRSSSDNALYDEYIF